MPRIVRKQNPPAFRNYKKYKPYLRLDFGARCAYCHIPELRYGPTRNYTVDHFRPKSIPEFWELIRTYSNLFYVCQDCNTAKGAAWPSPSLQRFGFRFLDPCVDDFDEHWTLKADGSLRPRSGAGEYMAARVKLNRPYLRAWRRSRADLAAQIEEVGNLIAGTKASTPEHAIAVNILSRLEAELVNEFTQ